MYFVGPTKELTTVVLLRLFTPVSFQVVFHRRMCVGLDIGRGGEPRRRGQDPPPAVEQGRLRAELLRDQGRLRQDLPAGGAQRIFQGGPLQNDRHRPPVRHSPDGLLLRDCRVLHGHGQS